LGQQPPFPPAAATPPLHWTPWDQVRCDWVLCCRARDAVYPAAICLRKEIEVLDLLK
jgi:hypothetical protein